MVAAGVAVAVTTEMTATAGDLSFHFPLTLQQSPVTTVMAT